MATAGSRARPYNLPIVALGAVVAIAGFGVTLALARSSAPAATSTATAAVVVAARDLDARTVLQASDLSVARWASSSLPPATLQRKESAVGMVLEAPLKAGQPVLANQVASEAGATGQQSAFLPLGKGYVAATVPSGELVGVAGYVQAGDYINIIAIVPRAGGTANARTIYSGLRVIRVGPAGTGSTAQPSAGSTSSLTIAVSECQAEYLSWFITNASLKYTLLAHDDYQAAAAAAPDTQCPSGGSAKSVTEADVRSRWPGLL